MIVDAEDPVLQLAVLAPVTDIVAVYPLQNGVPVTAESVTEPVPTTTVITDLVLQPAVDVPAMT